MRRNSRHDEPSEDSSFTVGIGLWLALLFFYNLGYSISINQPLIVNPGQSVIPILNPPNNATYRPVFIEINGTVVPVLVHDNRSVTPVIWNGNITIVTHRNGSVTPVIFDRNQTVVINNRTTVQMRNNQNGTVIPIIIYPNGTHIPMNMNMTLPRPTNESIPWYQRA